MFLDTIETAPSWVYAKRPPTNCVQQVISLLQNHNGENMEAINLSPYSPDLNPIECWFGCTKKLMERTTTAENGIAAPAIGACPVPSATY